MDDLLLRHFGLRENPFGVTPDPRFLFMSRTHREALASLVNGIACGFGFQVLVAQPGMGKTTLLFDFLERFNSSRTAFLFQQQHDSREFLQSLLVELKSESEETSNAKLYGRLNQLLSEAAQTHERVIVVVDEAQNLEDPVLETLRQLSNFETARSKLLQIVLAGQPQLAKKLARPEQEQLRQRVSAIARLSPLGLDEARTYLNHRLNIAGYRGAGIFTTLAAQSVWSNAHGIPRNMNTLCFNAMLLAYAQGAKRVDEPAVKEAAQDLDLDYVLADVAGTYRTSIKLGDQIPTSRTGPDGQKQNSDPQPMVSPLSPTNGRQPVVAVPGASLAVIGVEDRNPISDEKKPGDQQPVALPVSKSQHPQSLMASPAPAPRTSPGKKVLLASLVAAAVGAGVFFGHGLGARGQPQVEERPEWISSHSRQDPQPVLEAPMARSQNDKTADADPDVVVRTFPQSAPDPPDGAAQQDVKAIFFDGDSTAVSSRYDITLQRIAEILGASPQLTAIIEGHTDNSGDEPYNLELSARRATAVKDVLANEYNIPTTRLSTVGAGSSAPLESNATSSGRAYNRRVEVRIMRPGG